MDRISSASKVYLDANVIVYFVEAVHDFYDHVRLIFDIVHAANAKIYTNEMTLAECLNKPTRSGDFALVADYTRFFKDAGVTFLTVNLETNNRAAKEALHLNLKTDDAIHYLSALEAGCDYFITSDQAFKSGPQMSVILIKKS